jgi:outer membrane biosynthesis protein TonB
MVVDRSDKLTLRIGRLELSRLGWALAISLAAHLLFWGGYEVSKHFNLNLRLHLPQWLQRLVSPPPPEMKTPPSPREPYLFVDVSEAQSVVEPPKDTIRYSDRSAIAANPDETKNLTEPKIDGEKNELQKTEDGQRRNKFDQLMPDPAQPETEVQPRPKPGTMTVAKADLRPPQEHKRPRTLKERMQMNNQTPGKASKRDGGAAIRGRISYDVKMTGFGAYDRALIDAVQNRWDYFLDSLSADNYQQGKVVVQFDLTYEGRVNDVTILENTVSESLGMWCWRAIYDPGAAGDGYGRWTREMRLAVGEDKRRIKFTFYYY